MPFERHDISYRKILQRYKVTKWFKNLCFITKMFCILFVMFFVLGTSNKTCECLENTSGLGLDGGLRAVRGTEFMCNNRTNCIEKLCTVNSNPKVAWITFRVSC